MMGFNFTFLVGPKAQAPFYQLNDEIMSQTEIYGQVLKPAFGKDVVFAADLSTRNQQFQRMAFGLRSARLKSYVPKIEKETRDFLKSWGESGETDLHEELSRLIILSSSRCLHGDDVFERISDDVARLFKDLGDGLTAFSIFLPHAPIPKHIRRDKARKKMLALVSDVIKMRKAEKVAGVATEDYTDMLQVLVDMTYKDGRSNTNDRIVGLLIALLFAGQHTTSITSIWTTLLCTRDPKMLARVMEEQQTVLKDPSTPLAWEHIGQMQLLHNCMREALRLFTPVDFKVTSKGRTFTVPKGHIIGSSTTLSMRLPDVFNNPDKFDPDRFGPERAEHKQNLAYIAFGAGMHQCMGQQFAFVQVKTILSVLLREYNIEMLGELPEPDFEAVVARPKGECKIRYTKKTVAFGGA